jgi:ribose transport system permease protein
VTTRQAPSAAVTSFVVGSRYMPVYIALGLLIVVALIWAPQALNAVSLRAMAPYAALLGIAALGEMLVIMTGGIDLSIPGTMSVAAVVMVAVGGGLDQNIGKAILVALLAAGAIGLVNGILIGGIGLNPLIVTLAVGQIALGMIGIVNRSRSAIAVQAPVPPGWSSWIKTPSFLVSPVFWIGLGLTVIVAVVLRYTTFGRRFQAVGANPVAAHILGVRVKLNRIMVYVVAALFYGISGLALAGLLTTPGVSAGTAYLLGPIAAVVIGGASLTGGLASPVSTFAAAVFLTLLDRVMRAMGLPTSLQLVVFGLVIIGGMLVSGDRIIKGVEQLLRERRRPTRAEVDEILSPMNE